MSTNFFPVLGVKVGKVSAAPLKWFELFQLATVSSDWIDNIDWIWMIQLSELGTWLPLTKIGHCLFSEWDWSSWANWPLRLYWLSWTMPPTRRLHCNVSHSVEWEWSNWTYCTFAFLITSMRFLLTKLDPKSRFTQQQFQQGCLLSNSLNKKQPAFSHWSNQMLHFQQSGWEICVDFYLLSARSVTGRQHSDEGKLWECWDIFCWSTQPQNKNNNTVLLSFSFPWVY